MPEALSPRGRRASTSARRRGASHARLIALPFWLASVGLALALSLGGCLARPLLSDLSASSLTVRADGSGIGSDARVTYDLGSRADVTVQLIGPDGTQRVLRETATRAPDRYEVRFDGTVPDAAGNRRVVPDGTYRLQVVADDGAGRRQAQAVDVTVVAADTQPVEVLDLQTDLARFTPDGDGSDDEVRISYRLTKDAEVTVYVTDEQGTYYAIDPWRKRQAAMLSHLWDGTTGGRVMGGRLLPNGKYLVHVEARDAAGNASGATVPVELAGGGTPRLEITDVKFSPIAIVLGGMIDVRVTVRNTGTSAIHSWGPAPGYTYTAPEENYASIRNPTDPGKPAFFERRGIWRVGVTWQNAPSPLPLRWGLFPPAKKADGTEDWDARVLAPGQSVTVQGQVRVNIKEDSRQVRFSAGVVQEGVGFGERVGEQMVQVGW